MATKKKKKKLSTPIIFIQDTGIFTNEILVCAGATQKEILSFGKKHHLHKGAMEWIKNDSDMFSIFENNSGAYCWNDKTRVGLLLLKEYKDEWSYWETLAHEICHIVHQTKEQKRMETEYEAQAYLFEYLFRNIRRKLQGIK